MPEGQLANRGYTVIADFLSHKACDLVAAQLSALGTYGAGTRRLLTETWCGDLAADLKRHGVVGRLLPPGAVAVQCTFFDKSPVKNWLVSLHQDLSIPVRARVAAAECSGRTEKEGDIFVQPPTEVLEALVAVRVHVDDCPKESGALRVVPGSHKLGRLASDRVPELRQLHGEITVPVPRGGALVLKPLLLHASSKSTSDAPRRVLHFVFGPPTPPAGLEWRYAV